MSDQETLKEDRRRPIWQNRWLRLGAGLSILAVIVYLGRDQLGELDRLLRASPWAVAAILLLYMATRFMSGEVLRLCMLRIGVRAGVMETFLMTIIVTYTNFLVPHAGWGGPAIYFKRKYGLPLASFGALMLPLIVLQVACMGMLGLVCMGLTLIYYQATTATYLVAAVFLGCAVGGLAPLFLRVPELKWSRFERLSSFLRRLNASWVELATSGPTIAVVLAIQFIVLLVRAWRLDVALQAVGQEASFLGVLTMSLLADIMLLTSITPSGLGLREAAIALGADLFQIPMDVALAAALLDRVVWMIGVIIVAQIGLWSMFRR